MDQHGYNITTLTYNTTTSATSNIFIPSNTHALTKSSSSCSAANLAPHQTSSALNVSTLPLEEELRLKTRGLLSQPAPWPPFFTISPPKSDTEITVHTPEIVPTTACVELNFSSTSYQSMHCHIEL